MAARAAAGEDTACEEIFMRYKDRIFSLCLRMAGDYHLAEDLLQDGFMRAFRNLAQFRGDSALGTWLYRVVANNVISRLRQSDPAWEPLEEVEIRTDPYSASMPAEAAPQVWQSVDLEKAMAELPAGYRAVLVLHDVEGWEHEEIAALQRCSVGTSKSQLHKARLKMRELLLGRKQPQRS